MARRSGKGRLWPIHFWPSCLASQFWPIHFWPKLEVSGWWFANFGQSIFGQSFFCVCCCGWFWCGKVFSVVCFCFVVCVCCVLCFCFVVCFNVVVCCVECVCVVGVFRAFPPDRPPPDRLKFRSFFFPPPATVFILFSLSCWSFSLNFGGVFEDRDAPAAWSGGAAGVSHDSPTTQTCTFQAPALQNTKFHEKTPRETQKERNGGGKRKSAKFCPPILVPTLLVPTLLAPTLLVPTLLAGPSGPAPTLWGRPPPFGAPPFGPPHFFWIAPPPPLPWGPHHDTKKCWPKNWIGQKIGLAKKNWIGQNWLWPKLAGPKPRWPKMDWPGQNHDGQKWIGQNWIGQNWSNQDAKTGLAKVGFFRRSGAEVSHSCVCSTGQTLDHGNRDFRVTRATHPEAVGPASPMCWDPRSGGTPQATTTQLECW